MDMTSKEWVKKDLDHIWHPCSQMKDYETYPPIVIDHAKGSYLYDVEGKRYIDGNSSWWCNLLGHCHPRINAAIKRQLDKVEQVMFADFSHEAAIILCERLSELLPSGLSKFFFSSDGASSVEVALKMSYQYHLQTGRPQKTKFMCLQEGYHGETLGALSVMGVDAYYKAYKPLLLDVFHVDSPDCYRCKYGQKRDTCHAECFASVETCLEKHEDEIAAFIIEPLLLGSAGMKVYSPIYLKKMRQACTNHHVLMIVDEIATGFGRTGKLFACEHAEVSPDIMCLSKGLTGGYLPMSLTVTTPDIYEAFYAEYDSDKAFLHSHTYSGNPLACSAAIEVLNILKEEHILEIAKENAVYFKELIHRYFSDNSYVGDIRSIGLINAIELVRDKKSKACFDPACRYGHKIYREALKSGVILRPINDILYFNPPLNISREDMQYAVQVCADSVDNIMNKGGHHF